MVFNSKAKEVFGITPIPSDGTDQLIRACERAYMGVPDWLDEEDHITTINFAETLCSEVASLTTLGLGITVDGSARADWLQQEMDKIYYILRHWTEYACVYGTVILKPNGTGIDFVMPEDYIITAQDGEKISGAVFIDRAADNRNYFTRLEYHRFEGENYVITNKCYIGASANDPGKPIDIKDTPWKDISEEVVIGGLTQPLYAVFRTPPANNVEIGSPSGMPIFSEAMQELEDLDVSYSRMVKEIRDSKRTVLLDSDRLLPSGGKVSVVNSAFDTMREEMGLPDYVKNVYGDGVNAFYQEINPTINTDARIVGLNALLSQIGFKAGFSDGYFVFDQKTGMITATQVESDDRRTIRSIKDMRDKLEDCLNSLIYALNAFADLYALAPAGAYQVTFDFGDITYNREEDKARWYGYVTGGHVPFWYFLVKFEGFSEDEAKAISQEPEKTALFDYGE